MVAQIVGVRRIPTRTIVDDRDAVRRFDQETIGQDITDQGLTIAARRARIGSDCLKQSAAVGVAITKLESLDFSFGRFNRITG